MDQIAIGTRIKAARERVHLTQEQLAEIVDISPTHMSVIERGVKTPKLDTFVRIANALGVSTDALLQDVVVPVTDNIVAELSVRIGRLHFDCSELDRPFSCRSKRNRSISDVLISASFVFPKYAFICFIM